MKKFEFKARDKFGKSLTGSLEGESEKAVIAQLKANGSIPIYIKQVTPVTDLEGILSKFKKVKFVDVNMFTRQFAALQRAGLSIRVSLRTLGEETANEKFKNVLLSVEKDIEEGKSLSEALSRHPGVFDPLYINMIKTGEVSGTLDEGLERLAGLGEYEERVHQKIKAALRYPVLVVIAIVIAFLILTVVVVPRFSKIYDQFDTALPLPTQILIGINYAITKFWWALLIMAGILGYGIKKALNTRKGKFFWDSLILKIPVFGPLILKLTMSRFTRITGVLLRSGVPLIKILELASKGTGNIVISETIADIGKGVREGKNIAEPMKTSGVFPAVVIQMTSLGEQTGKLDELLLHVSNYYDAQVEYAVNNLTALIEPILISVLGVMVLFMALGIFLPLWDLMSLFKK